MNCAGSEPVGLRGLRKQITEAKGVSLALRGKREARNTEPGGTGVERSGCATCRVTLGSLS